MTIKCEHGIVISQNFQCTSCNKWIQDFSSLAKNFNSKWFNDKSFKVEDMDINCSCELCKEVIKRIVKAKQFEEQALVYINGKHYSLREHIEKDYAEKGKKREMKKYHCAHCGKSTIVEI